MKIWKIANKFTSENLEIWIKNLVDSEFGGGNSANEGWCGEISGEIYRFLKSQGESPEIWGIVSWIDNKEHPEIIEQLTDEEKECIDNQTCGGINHSYVKWNGELWDGKGRNSLDNMLRQHAFGKLGNGISIVKEY
jgi:hypothetical protein